MAPALQKLMDEIEGQRQAVLASVAGLSDEQFNHSPGPGKWSAAEVLSHIITAERMSVAYLQKKIVGIDQASSSGIWEEIKIIALIFTQRMPGLKFKAPKRVVESTKVMTNRSELENSWNQVRSELKELLEKIPDHQLNRLVYRHVVAGYLNIRHALIFFREHMHHHRPQLHRLLHQPLTANT